MTELLDNLSEIAVSFLQKRDAIQKESGIDILQTDNIRKLIIWRNTRSWIPSLTPNLSKNGSDFYDGNDEIEMKSTQVTMKKRNSQFGKASYMFHVEGDIIHTSFLFVNFNKVRNEQIVKIIYVKDRANAEKISQYLQTAKSEYFEKHSKVRKYDVITVSEDTILELIGGGFHSSQEGIDVITDYCV